MTDALDWTLVRSFLATVDHGSLSSAAKALHLTQPTIGRHIDTLEACLGKKLFVRSVHGLLAQEAALDLIPYARTMAAASAAFTRTAAGQLENAHGVVRVAASEVVGVEVLPTIITDMRRADPKIAVELALSNRNENLLLREADVAVRMVRPTQKSLVAKKIGDVPILLYAHERYVKRKGLPKTIAELTQHDLIGYDGHQPTVVRLHPGGSTVSRESFVLRTDSDVAQIALLRAGAGIGGLQQQIAARDADLRPVLHRAIRLPLEIWLVMHEDLRASRHIRLVFDYLAAALARHINQRPG